MQLSCKIAQLTMTPVNIQSCYTTAFVVRGCVPFSVYSAFYTIPTYHNFWRTIYRLALCTKCLCTHNNCVKEISAQIDAKQAFSNVLSELECSLLAIK